MSIRKVPFVEKEYYHIYNRGVDKRDIFMDALDLNRFMQSMIEFNVVKPIGSIYENSQRKRKNQPRGSKASTIEKETPLVNFIAYGINRNHFHLILEQVAEKGIEKFMHRLGTGHSNYFNARHKRSGSLFQGKFKAKLIDSNEYLLHLSAYINLNDRAHTRGSKASTLSWTSWEEYTDENFSNGICRKEIVLGQFKNKKGYKKFAEESLEGIIKRKILLEELEDSGVDLVKSV